MEKYDIAVIGGGASGLAAAISAKRVQKKLRVALLERLPRVGKKILATGNGRCNLANVNIGREKYFGSCKELCELCKSYPYEEFFSSLGVLTIVDDMGRVYPNSEASSSVLDALRLEADALGVETICGFEVTGIEKGFTVCSNEDMLKAERVIIAGGGKSQPSLGSNGSMLKICRELGLNIREPFPALTPLKTDPALVGALKGQRAAAKASLFIDGKEAASELGEVQFGDGVISGICIFDLSCINGAAASEIVLDLLPKMSEKETAELFKALREKRKNAALEDYLSGVFSKRVAMYITKHSIDKPLSCKTSSLSDDDVIKISKKAKSLCFPVKGALGFERSQVTGGGVICGETDENLRSKKINGLYLCGEILDIHGKCGGYNLAFAFASGQHAGKSCAESLMVR